MNKRHELLGSVLGRMETEDREAAARIARRFAGFAGDAASFSATGPLPL